MIGEVLLLSVATPFSSGVLVRRLVALVLIAAVTACSSAEVVPSAPAELCARPGTWAILTRPSASAAAGPPAPLTSGSAAAAGARTGGLGSLQTGASLAGETIVRGSGTAFDLVFAGIFLAAGIAMAPVAAIVGAGVGAGTARSESEIVAAEASMTGALQTEQPLDAIRSRVVALVDEQAGRRAFDCGALRSPEACREKSPEPVVVVLGLTVSAPYFEVEGSITPDLRLVLSADAEVTVSGDTAAAYRRAWVYRGRQHGYFELAADDAALFRDELQAATDALAAKIVDDLLIGGRDEVQPSAEQPEGSVWTVFPPGRSNREAGCT